ncbi:toxin-antitoxin system HicB family antitoxin [Bradyrhizobium sp. NC92]|uniref:toxin-antitoxin system HicB family antitoxin n=1 Tax=Bradyrhizobium sp. (strain NC92) TaxID=55395 RepID=UPI0021AA1AEF|nr:toxin-antitoxin system HicB family antitoxin [Bradyrhizobium sp. NC92]UWU72613.1 toxin-antitoxin system HicB family antitoxin [Bradyrhizobium sp. NC92]
MSTVRYRDYQGSVDFEDNKLLIRVLHIDDLITTEVESAADVEAAFAELVEDYLATCTEAGKEPARPFKGLFNVRVPPDLHRQAAFAAAREDVTLNSFVTSALEDKLNPPEPKSEVERPEFAFQGFLRLALVTCPVRLHFATEDAPELELGAHITIEIENFAKAGEIEPIYCAGSYYLVPEGRVGHDAYAVIREAMAANKVIGIATLGKHTFALEPQGDGMVATLLRNADQVRVPSELFDTISNVKITKEMLDLAKHIVEKMIAAFDPRKLMAAPKPRRKPSDEQPKLALNRGDNVIDLKEALRKSMRRDAASNTDDAAPRRKA